LTLSGTHAGKEYYHILSDEDAEKGANFYCYKNDKEWSELKDWAKMQNKKVDFSGNGLKNLLRSEHIPYNLFYPLEKLRMKANNDLELYLNSLFDFKLNITKVLSIQIESATRIPKKNLLDDNTSFDTYIEYLDGQDKCGIGIEIKYTELSYPYGETEKERMYNPESEYILLTNRCGIFKDGSTATLRSKKLKQPWRNQLLGIKLVQIGELKKFHSVHMFPEGNLYQKQVCDEYLKLIKEDSKSTFIPLTFEKFIQHIEDYDSEIAQYLTKRY
jgi:hypothetical protein